MKQESVLRVLALLDTMLTAAKENSFKARDPGSRAYAEGMVFALTIAGREVGGLVDAGKTKSKSTPQLQPPLSTFQAVGAGVVPVLPLVQRQIDGSDGNDGAPSTVVGGRRKTKRA